MAWYFRRSVNLGGIRLNFSKSGVGASTGIPGFRIGIDAKGRSYVRGGGHGLYFHERLGPKRPESAPRAVVGSAGRTHGEYLVSSSGATHFDVDDLTTAICDAMNRLALLPWAVFGFAALTALGIYLVVAPAHTSTATTAFSVAAAVLCVIAGIVLLEWSRRLDRSKVVYLQFELDGDARLVWDRCCGALLGLGHGTSKVIHAAADVYDKKYHSGASSLVKTHPLRVYAARRLRFVSSDLDFPALELHGHMYHFLPDRIVSSHRGKIGVLRYDSLTFDPGNTDIIESHAPPGGNVVGTTWAYTNKNGGPDRRFSHNPQLVVIRYASIRMQSTNGLDHTIVTTSDEVGKRFVQCLKAMADLRETSVSPLNPIVPEGVPSAVQSTTDPEDWSELTTNEKTPAPAGEWLTETILEAMCCIVCADKAVTNAERSKVQHIMASLKAPWREERIEEHVRDFCRRAQQNGLTSVVNATLERLQNVIDLQQQTAIRKSLRILLNADGKVTESERLMFRRLTEAFNSAQQNR